MIGMELDTYFSEGFSAQRFFEMVGRFKALKALEIHIPSLLEREKEMVVPLITLLQGLPHLERLIISGMFILVRNSF